MASCEKNAAQSLKWIGFKGELRQSSIKLGEVLVSRTVNLFIYLNGFAQ